MARNDAAAPSHGCPGICIASALVVLVVAAPPEAGLVAPLGGAVEPLVHAPQAVHAARIGGIGVVDAAVLECERAQALPLTYERRPVGAGSGCDLGGRSLLAGPQQRPLVLGAEVVFHDVRPLLILSPRRLEVVVEIAAERRRPGEAPPHPPLVRLQLRERGPRHRRKRDVVIREVDDGAVEAIGNRRAGRTPRPIVGPEHEVVDEELRAPSEEIRQRGAALLGIEFVLLVDPDPRQLLPALRQLVAAPRQLFLRLKQLEPSGKPLFPCSGCVLRHRASLFPVSSTNALKRSAASSHCAAMWSRYRLALSRRLRFRSQTRSRPRRAWRTSPASPRA